jgi:hypothetical protein
MAYPFIRYAQPSVEGWFVNGWVADERIGAIRKWRIRLSVTRSHPLKDGLSTDG